MKNKDTKLTKWIPACAGMTLLLGVFFAYTRPDFMVTIANQVWLCF